MCHICVREGAPGTQVQNVWKRGSADGPVIYFIKIIFRWKYVRLALSPTGYSTDSAV